MMQPMGLGALKQFGVNIGGQVEELAWSLYDFTTYALAGQTTLTFFQSPQGSGGKTYQDTNMSLAAQIPAGQNFLAQAIAVEFQPGQSPETITATNKFTADANAVHQSGWVEFKIGSKLYVQEGPMGNFPPAYRLAGQAAAATTVAATSMNVDYASSAGQIHAIIPVLITSNQNFSVTLNWPTVLALPSAANGRIGVRLIGRLFRNAQ